ncbi:3-hexulose-6-phosphate synthase [Methanomassiliicoccus luminyensis]|jgi:3-hexulose-6-phosphate synthase/6-phospho-3-hexuloisomerase|uniref:3-hexulose-6-phosphate synthase n=1 Tax=Methanomassiliicoccus luminyensis TaxID=1080712 RepID=UPI00036404AA|nr:3-hexulose-6-phosphate synthase [Methanomassiliicoccus luminyensis]
MKPVLQVALDLMHLKRAVEIAGEAVEGGADWIEAGTPLIKSEGVDSIRTLKRAFPGHVIVADMKTMDVGGAEVEIAAKGGADVVSVLGLSDDGTIREAVLSARQYGAKVMVDMIGVVDRPSRAKRAEELGASYICLHVGIDEQMKGSSSPLEVLKKVSEAVSIPIAVAGGITSETAPELMKAGASIVIVGGGIIKAENVTAATRKVKDAMLSGEGIANELSKKYGKDELFTAFSKVSTCNIADAQHKSGVMKNILPRIDHGVKMVGRALTVQTSKGDWAKPVEAIDRASDGDVLVVDAGGSDIAVFGELAAWSGRMRGVRGVVIDGAVRDVEAIYEMGFPAFSRHIAPNAGEPKGYGGIGHEIICGEMVVRTGDWIIGDESGVVVVPQEMAVEIANRSLDVAERENRVREEIKRGGTLSKVQELEKWEQVH